MKERIHLNQAPGMGEAPDSVAQTEKTAEDSGVQNSKIYGYNTKNGKLQIEEGDTGTTILLDNDQGEIHITDSGHISIKSNSGSGITIIASAGPVAITAPQILLKSKGDFMIESGGNINMNAKGDINLSTPTGSIKETAQSRISDINGICMQNIGRDMNTIIGGHSRMTVGGQARVQVSNSYTLDAKSTKMRSDGEFAISTRDSLNMYSDQDSSLHTKGNMTISSDAQMNIESKGNMTQVSEGEMVQSAKGKMDIASGGNLNMSSKSKANLAASGDINVDMGGNMNVDMGGASVIEPSNKKKTQASEKAQIPPETTVIDTVTTTRKTPEYPYNANFRANAGTSRMRNEGGSASGSLSQEDLNTTPPPITESVGSKATIVYTNQNAIRNLPVTPELEDKLAKAAAVVYGEGSKVEIYSGGQCPKGTCSRRTGSTRHDNGKAADVYIYRPDGSKVKGNDLARMGQYWLAMNYGSVGLAMRNWGIHLDVHTDRGRYWFYGTETSSMREQVKRAAAGMIPASSLAWAGDGQGDRAKILPKGSEADKKIVANKKPATKDVEG